jgi:predicted alpha/beta superfamily hydrolase
MKTSFPRVELFQTEKRTLFSKLIGREYQLSIQWPRFPEPTQKRFPVLYFLDSDTFFGLAAFLCYMPCSMNRASSGGTSSAVRIWILPTRIW